MDPEGRIVRIMETLEKMEASKVSTAVEIGGFVFKDVDSVQAWVSTVGEDILGKFCVDMVTLFTLSQEPFVDIASGMQAHLKQCSKTSTKAESFSPMTSRIQR